jgi:transposase
MCTHLVTFYDIHAKRGREAMNDLGILPAFTGTLVTDALASYTVYGNDKALCGAHVLRELIAVTEDTRRDPAWAKAVIDVLIEAKDAVADALAAGQDALAPDTLTGFQDRYRQAVLCGIAVNPHTGKGRSPRPEHWPNG